MNSNKLPCNYVLIGDNNNSANQDCHETSAKVFSAGSFNLFLIIFLIWSLAFLSNANGAAETQHKTKAASEKHQDLWCYRCDTMIDGEKCLDVISSNHTGGMFTKCTKEQKKCQVRRISMSTSTDEVTGKPKLWLLQRNCTESCEPGCIVVGERTKLHSCIMCCDEHNFCNAGTGGATTATVTRLAVVNFLFLLLFELYYSRCF